MTPEQILIDGLRELCYCERLKEQVTNVSTCHPCRNIERYNEAKAQEATPQTPRQMYLRHKTLCQKCSGDGIILYTSTAKWRGGIGGAAMTYGECNVCWGSGTDKPWPSHKEAELRKHARASVDKNKELLDLLDNDPPAIFIPEVAELFRKPSVLEKNAQAQDLLTAAPLAEALRGFCDHTECDDNGYTIRGTCCSCEALTQHEALIKQSKAVWAMVKLALEHFEGVEDTCPEIIPDETRLILKALPVEALELMEMKQL